MTGLSPPSPGKVHKPSQARARCLLAAEAAGVATLALLALLVSGHGLVGDAIADRMWVLLAGGGGGGGGSTRLAAHSAGMCARWAAVHRLSGGCMAQLAPEDDGGVKCCGGPNYACDPRGCPADKLAALRCVAPRQLLLRPADGCTVGVSPPAACSHLSAAQVEGGRWVPPPAPAPGLPPLLFESAGAAPRRPLGGAEVPGWLLGAGFDRVLVSGDSTVRHVYNRLVGLVRQQDALIDGGGIAHAHYRLRTWPGEAGGGAVAAAAGFATDELWVSPAANWQKGIWDEAQMAEGLSHLLNRTLPAAAPMGQEPQAPAAGQGLTVDFVVGAHATWQVAHVRQYLAARGGAPGWRRRTLAVLSLCVWEQTKAFPRGWLDFVEEVRRQVGQLVLLTCPLDRLQRPQHAAGKVVVRERNEALRAMVSAARGGSAPKAAPGAPAAGGEEADSDVGAAQLGAPLALVDVDALTRHLPPGLDIAPTDFHFQCMLGSRGAYNGTGPLAWAGGDGSPTPAYPRMRYEEMLRPPVGHCADPVNHAIVQLLLSLVC